MSEEEIDQAVKSLDLRKRKNAELSTRLGGVAPSVNVTNWAALEGHLDVVQWLWEKEVHVSLGTDMAARGGHLDVVQWLWEKGVHATVDGADWAAKEGHLDVDQWLWGKRVHPDED